MSYRFSSPTYRAARPGDRFWIRLLDTVHLTVLRKDGAYLTVEGPSNEELDDADAFWLGGHENIVSDQEADALRAAGYGAFLTFIETPAPPPTDPGETPPTDPGDGGPTPPTDPPPTPPAAPTDPPEYGAGPYGAGIYGS